MSAANNPRPPRLYAPIWNALKEKKTVSITANRLLHPRIVKAVIKEKYNDIGYKIAMEPKRAELSYTQENSILTFKLTITLTSVEGLEL